MYEIATINEKNNIFLRSTKDIAMMAHYRLVGQQHLKCQVLDTHCGSPLQSPVLPTVALKTDPQPPEGIEILIVSRHPCFYHTRC